MAFQPIILNNATLSLDGDAFEGQISGAVFTPSAAVTNWTAINSDTYSFTAPATWTLDLTYAVDIDDAAALARYLHTAEGSVVVAIFEPVDGGPTVTANVSITPGSIGAADSATVASATVSLGSTKPVLGAVTP